MEGIRGITQLFQTIVSLSLVGSYCILLVLLVRLAIQKAPRWCSYLLWGIVFLRLICPVFPETGFSLIPEVLRVDVSGVFAEDGADAEHAYAENVDVLPAAGQAQEYDKAGMPQTGQNFHMSGQNASSNSNGASAQGTNAAEQGSDMQGQGTSVFAETIDISIHESSTLGQSTDAFTEGLGVPFGSADSEPPLHSASTAYSFILSACSCLWLMGAVLLVGYHTFSYLRLKGMLKSAVPAEPGVKEVQGEHLSFVMGIFCPVIYLSEGLDEESRRVVLCHERVHL